MSVVYPSSCDASGKSIKVANTTSGENSYFTGHNVGIGTTSPPALLTVVGSAADIGNGIGQFINTGLTDEEGENYNFLLVGKAADYEQSAVFGYLYSSTPGNSGAFLTVWGDDTNSLFVKVGGNVGIGTMNASSKLTVAGGASIGANLAGTAAPANGLIVQGSVGIGSTSPSCALDVAGTVKASTALVKPATDSTSAFEVQKSDGTSVLNVDTTNGMVGIGTTEPPVQDSTMLLTVAKAGTANCVSIDNYYTNSISTGYLLFHKSNSNTMGTKNTTTAEMALSRIMSYGVDYQNNWKHGSEINSIQETGDGGTDVAARLELFVNSGSSIWSGIVIKHDGVVGIGTTSPGEKLDVNGNIRTSGRLLIAGSAPANAIGASGDQAGMIAWNASYLFVCTANYDGTTHVWKRAALSSY